MSGGGADEERPHKKLRFLETFLRYLRERGERMGSGYIYTYIYTYRIEILKLY